MKRLLRRLVAQGMRNSEWLVLLAVAATGAWQYVEAAQAHAERAPATCPRQP